MKDDLSLAINKFVESGNKILELWSKDMDNLNQYPFNKSFDEVMVDVGRWLSPDEKSVKEIEYKELEGLNSVYGSISRKIDSYHETKDVGVLFEIEHLEKEFSNKIKELTYAKNKQGDVLEASKSKNSINAITIGGEDVSYYHFFKNYKPYTTHNRK